MLVYVWGLLLAQKLGHWGFSPAQPLRGVASQDPPVCWGLNCVPPENICWSFKPQYLWMWPYLEKRVFADVLKMQINMRSYWIRVGPITGVLIRRDQRHTGTHRQNTMWWPGRDCSDSSAGQEHWGLPASTRSWKMRGRILRALRGSGTLPKPWFQTSGLQNCERINFCCFKTPSLWEFVLAALGNQYTAPNKFFTLCLPAFRQRPSQQGSVLQLSPLQFTLCTAARGWF